MEQINTKVSDLPKEGQQYHKRLKYVLFQQDFKKKRTVKRD